MTMDYPYQIYDRYGTPVLQAKEECRYPKEIERGLLEHGYTIKLHGKRITKKDVNGK